MAAIILSTSTTAAGKAGMISSPYIYRPEREGRLWNGVPAGGRRRPIAYRAAPRMSLTDPSLYKVSQKNADPGKYKYRPEVFFSEKGEKFLFQAGETMLIEELPENTRVIYGGVRKDGTRDVQTIKAMILKAIQNPVGSQQPFREKLKTLVEKGGKSGSPKVVFAFDDTSIPLPPMSKPDIRSLIMETCEGMCVEEGITDIEFVCSIALHRFIRPDEFKELCGDHLYSKYWKQNRMHNFNAIDKEFCKHLGYTKHGEDVEVCKLVAEADLMVYVNVNYVSMDGGYKSYATGLVTYNSLKHNHDSKTLTETKSLYDPQRSAMHKSFNRIGKIIQKEVDIFHVETVIDENLFPWFLNWIVVLKRNMSVFQKTLMWSTVLSLKLVPLFLRKWILWAVRGQQGLLQIRAGETSAVHEETLRANWEDKVLEIDGQSDIVIISPTAIGPYTKDMYLNPLLVNTYALGYYFNMYVGGTPLLKKGGVVIVVCEMHYTWSSPAHDTYRDMFENVIAVARGLDEFEKYQDQYVESKRLNDIYRQGKGPAGVHPFYMYTWAAHGMDHCGKVIVVNPADLRGPEILGWQVAPSIMDAVAAARQWLANSEATV